MTTGAGSEYHLLHRDAFVSPVVCASNSPITTFKRCRQEQGATSRRPSSSRMTLLPDAVGTAASRRLRPRAPSLVCGGEGGGRRGSAGERERGRLFMFLGQRQKKMAARGSGSEAAAAAAAAGAAADEHFVSAQQFYGRVAAAHPPQPQDQAHRGSSSNPSMTGLGGGSEQRPNGGALGGGSTREHELSATHATEINGHIGRAGGASSAQLREEASFGSSSSRDSSAPADETSSGRARRQRLRRRRERATMAAKKSLVKKVRSTLSDFGLGVDVNVAYR